MWGGGEGRSLVDLAVDVDNRLTRHGFAVGYSDVVECVVVKEEWGGGGRKVKGGNIILSPSYVFYNLLHVNRVGQNRICIRCLYTIYGREITKYTVISGVNIRFWPAQFTGNKL